VKRVRPVEMVVEEARVDVEEKHQQDRDYIDERQQGEDQERSSSKECVITVL
jgi:hypothetical protein